MPKILKSKSDYWIDAPDVRRIMALIAVIGLLFLVFNLACFVYQVRDFDFLFAGSALIGLFLFSYGAFMSLYMTWSSKIGKLNTRDTLLETVGQIRSWSDNELVVDVGCGRGLMLVGAAKRMSQGLAVGVDVWVEKDQSGNTPDATRRNAEIESVGHRVDVTTGDARFLPLEDGTVDVVMSHWVIHNIEPEADQVKALNEMWRVLKPGGVLVLADIAGVPKYVSHLGQLGARDIRFYDGGLEARVMGVLSGGTYVPQALVCSRPVEILDTRFQSTRERDLIGQARLIQEPIISV